MQLTMNTIQLQSMLNKAFKGAGNDKSRIMTTLIAISLKDGKLTVTTNDNSSHFFSLKADNVEGDDLYVAVNAELLVKLVSKLTSEKVTLETTDSQLRVIGNGQYDMEILLDDDGKPVILPNPIENFDKSKQVGTVDSAVIANVITSLKATLLATPEYPWYMNYYVGDEVLATDTWNVSRYSKGFLKEPYLISSETMDLVGLLLDEITVYVADDKMLFDSAIGSVYAQIPSNIERFSTEDFKKHLDREMDYSCKVSKHAMLNLLDRISLFVAPYDNGEIVLSFKEDGLEISSKKAATEVIQYSEPCNVGEFTCSTDISSLVTQFKCCTGSVVELRYGDDVALKLVDGDLIVAIALMGD